MKCFSGFSLYWVMVQIQRYKVSAVYTVSNPALGSASSDVEQIAAAPVKQP